MKYTLSGFQQDVLIKLGLDALDALIIRWYADFYLGGNMKLINLDHKTYGWVHYGKVMEDLPILNIKSRQIAKRFKKYVTNGLMLHKHILKNGSWSYFHLIPEMYGYLVGTGELPVDKYVPMSLQRERGVSSKREGMSLQSESNSSLNNDSIKMKEDTQASKGISFKNVDNLRNKIEYSFSALGVDSKLTDKNLSSLSQLIKQYNEIEVLDRFNMFIELCKLSKNPADVYYNSFSDFLGETEDGLGFDLENHGRLNYFGFSQVFEFIPQAYDIRHGILELFPESKAI